MTHPEPTAEHLALAKALLGQYRAGFRDLAEMAERTDLPVNIARAKAAERRGAVMASDQCPSVHKLGGMRCIRQAGHDGLCWNRAVLSETGAMTRAEWYSTNGVFERHYQYATSYAKPRVTSDEKGGG